METKLYTSKDLESLSSSELYTKGPDMSSPNVNLPSLTPSLNPGYENPGERLVQVPEKAPELERELYSKPIERQFPSNVGGLENLSASALYSGEADGIKGTEKMGNWGKKIPTGLPNTHITQTNENSRDGEGAHVTTNIPGEKVKVHDRYDGEGNYKGSNFAKR